MILPQAVSNSIPAFCANIIFLIKETSVFSAVALADLMFITKDLIGIYYKTDEALFMLVIAYLIILLPISLIAVWLKGGFAMQNMGISVLFKGNNFLRLCQGLWVTLRIALIAMIFRLYWDSFWE